MSGGGKSKKSSSSSTVEPPKYLSRAHAKGIEVARNIWEEGPPELYPEQYYADFDPLQKEAMNSVVDRARTGSPLVDSAQGFVQNTLDTQSGSNPYLDQMLAKLSRQANAQIASDYNMAGRYGSGSNAAAAGKAITDAQLPFLFNQFNTDQQLKANLSSLAPTLANQDYYDAAQLSNIGDIMQGQTQQGIDEDRMRYEYENGGGENAWLDQYLNRINSSAANQFTTTTNTQKQSGGGLASALGTGLSIASMFAGGGPFAAMGMGGGTGFGLGQTIGSMFSSSPMGPYQPYGICDVRAKENIRAAGSEKGIPMYLFNYKGQKDTYRGPMAQDVEKFMPDAVKEVDGLKMVNFDMLGIRPQLVH